MLRVCKWPVAVDDRSHAIGGGRVLHVDEDPGRPGRPDSVAVWTLETTHGGAEPARTRRVQAFGTGQPLPGTTLEHIGSAVLPPYAWHIIAVTE